MRVEFRTRDHRGTRWLAVCGPAAALLLAALAVPSNAEMPESYRKTWTELRPQIDSSIERHRKSDATIEVVDAEGKPVPDASLDIRQKTQTFLFGCNILPLGQLGDRNEAYEQGFVKLFNLATTTFCWERGGTEAWADAFRRGIGGNLGAARRRTGSSPSARSTGSRSRAASAGGQLAPELGAQGSGTSQGALSGVVCQGGRAVRERHPDFRCGE